MTNRLGKINMDFTFFSQPLSYLLELREWVPRVPTGLLHTHAVTTTPADPLCAFNEVVTFIIPLSDTGWNDNSQVGILSFPLKTRGFPRRTEICGLTIIAMKLTL